MRKLVYLEQWREVSHTVDDLWRAFAAGVFVGIILMLVFAVR